MAKVRTFRVHVDPETQTMRLNDGNLGREKLQSHFRLTDAEFEQQFAARTFPEELFTHEAHLRLAWIHLGKYGLERAIENVCAQIAAYTVHLGAKNKYHATVTVAAVKVIYHFMQQSNSDNFGDFIREFPRLNTQFRALLAQHYSIDIFASELAKQQYLEPDLLPFD